MTLAGEAGPGREGRNRPYQEVEAENGTTNGTMLGRQSRAVHGRSRSLGGRAGAPVGHRAVSEFTLTPADQLDGRALVDPRFRGNGSNSAHAGAVCERHEGAGPRAHAQYSWPYGAYPFHGDPDPRQAAPLLRRGPGADGEHGGGHRVSSCRRTPPTQPATTTSTSSTSSRSCPPPMPHRPATCPHIASYGAKRRLGRHDGRSTTPSRPRSQRRQGAVDPGRTVRARRPASTSRGVTVRGAGPWYSTVRTGNDGKGGLFGTGSNLELVDFSMLGHVTCATRTAGAERRRRSRATSAPARWSRTCGSSTRRSACGSTPAPTACTPRGCASATPGPTASTSTAKCRTTS